MMSSGADADASDAAPERVRRRTTSSSSSSYLYTQRGSHPVVEYLPTSEDARFTTTPSFVLSVTWPRLVQFYHPTSTRCVAFRPAYVALARELRKRAPLTLIQFHAVSCDSYRDVCDAFGVTGVPAVLAYQAGSIDGTWLDRRDDAVGTIDAEHAADVLGVTLSREESSSSSAAKGAAASERAYDAQADGRGRDDGGGVGGGGDDNGEEGAYERYVRMDATASLVSTLGSIPSSSLEASASSRRRRGGGRDGRRGASSTVDALRDFLDLLHWTIPPSWTDLHDLIRGLRRDLFDDASSSSPSSSSLSFHGRPRHQQQSRADVLDEALRRTRSAHGWGDAAQNGITSSSVVWSHRCNRGRVDRAAGYECGLWTLLHVVTIGVAERHKRVLGDLKRVSTSHAAWALRNFVDEFMTGCGSCREYFVRTHDDCDKFRRCDRLTASAERGGHGAVAGRHGGGDGDWRQLALWLWSVHNDVNERRAVAQSRSGSIDGGASSPFASKARWPAQDECRACYNVPHSSSSFSLFDAGDEDDRWYDANALYDHLKGEYWPSSVQSTRLVVIEPWRDRPRFRGAAAAAAAASRLAALFRERWSGRGTVGGGVVIVATLVLLNWWLWVRTLGVRCHCSFADSGHRPGGQRRRRRRRGGSYGKKEMRTAMSRTPSPPSSSSSRASRYAHQGGVAVRPRRGHMRQIYLDV